MRTMLLLGLVGCGAVDTDAPVDTDPAGDTDLPPACDFAAVAGDWAGTMFEGGWSYELSLHLDAAAELDAVVGVATYSSIRCVDDLFCLGRTQLDRMVVMERVRSGNCVDAYSFIQLKDDGTLTYESALSEFGATVSYASLVRVE